MNVITADELRDMFFGIVPEQPGEFERAITLRYSPSRDVTMRFSIYSDQFQVVQHQIMVSRHEVSESHANIVRLRIQSALEDMKWHISRLIP